MQPLAIAGRHDSIEADSIVKSARKADPTLSLGDSDSALEHPQAASDTGSNEGLHHTAPVLGQQEAVAGSLDHLSKNVMAAANGGAIDDPEQAFTQGEFTPTSVHGLSSITTFAIAQQCFPLELVKHKQVILSLCADIDLLLLLLLVSELAGSGESLFPRFLAQLNACGMLEVSLYPYTCMQYPVVTCMHCVHDK